MVSCAQVTSLGLKKHQFGQIPIKYIWIQVAGLNEEHLAMTKFGAMVGNSQTALEKMTCLGKAWQYNLYSLRPEVHESFLAQITGKKNIKNSCEDYTHRPVWSYMTSKNYRIGVFEGPTDEEESFSSALKCDENYLDNVTMWKMNENKSGKNFHQSETTNFEPGNIYYDRSCSKTKGCFTSFSNNVISVYQNYYRNSVNYLYMIRNFQFQKLLLENKISEARAELEQIEKTIDYFLEITKNETNMLVLVTSAHPYAVNYPREGKDWESYIKRKKFDLGSNSRLMAPVFASGARAENFCGIYDESEILSRIFSGAKQQGLEYTIINPFN